MAEAVRPSSIGVSLATISSTLRFEEADSRYHRLGHALRGGPSQGRVIQYDAVGIGHTPKIAFQQVRCIGAGPVSFVSSRWGAGCAPGGL